MWRGVSADEDVSAQDKRLANPTFARITPQRARGASWPRRDPRTRMIPVPVHGRSGRRPPIASPLRRAERGAFGLRTMSRGCHCRSATYAAGLGSLTARLTRSRSSVWVHATLPRSVPRARPELRGLHPGLVIDPAVRTERGYVINPWRPNATTHSDTPSASWRSPKRGGQYGARANVSSVLLRLLTGVRGEQGEIRSRSILPRVRLLLRSSAGSENPSTCPREEGAQ